MLLALSLFLFSRSSKGRAWSPPPPVAPFTHESLPCQTAVKPLIFPVIGKARWGKHYNVDRPYTRHTGIDIAAPKMSPIVASFTGILGFKRESYWIYSDDGWILLGTHLNDDNLGTHDHRGNRDVMFAPNLVSGMTVLAGQLIGYVGESGNATGPHLHFELYRPGKGPTQERIRNPFLSLRRSQILRAPRVKLPQPGSRPKKGYVRLQVCVRNVNPKTRTIKTILVAKQSSKGVVTVMTYPRYLSVRLSKHAIADLGGWNTLYRMASTKTVALYMPWTKDLSCGLVEYALASPSKR